MWVAGCFEQGMTTVRGKMSEISVFVISCLQSAWYSHHSELGYISRYTTQNVFIILHFYIVTTTEDQRYSY